ncbi:hypothetical protein KL86DPRO_10298 [uncultured delta proteobacterium]|uniref:Uncharacterized protein n=1 Tax=uncultured delta proteobacterium TaxID=34034 RepID=A0A212IY39_9DELT|nr:hypothetical protein KL86DPRO_10298 [uncultured delta proteobacterium]
MQCGVTDPALTQIPLDPATAYIVRNDTLQVIYITRREFDGKKLTMEGIGVEGLLAKRFTIEKDYLPTGENEGKNYVGVVMCDIINDNNPYHWLIADRTKNAAGPSIATYTELTGNVYKYIKMLAKAYDVGIKCVFNESANNVDFIAYDVTGIDVDIPGRTYRLSDELDNASDPEYEYDTSKYYNKARVIGDTFSVVVDQSNGKEVFEYSFKSKSRQKKLTEAEYAMILYGEGEQELAKRGITETFTMKPKPDVNIELGWETVTIGKNINKVTESFCTEIKETWEETYVREHTFGYKADDLDDLVTSLQGEI